MSDIQYVLERLGSIEKKWDEEFKILREQGLRTLVQTTETNGRVNAHDGLIERLQKDVEPIKKIVGFNRGRDWVVIGFFGVLSGFFISYFLGGGRQKEIEQAVEKYKIENNIKTK